MHHIIAHHIVPYLRVRKAVETFGCVNRDFNKRVWLGLYNRMDIDVSDIVSLHNLPKKIFTSRVYDFQGSELCIIVKNKWYSAIDNMTFDLTIPTHQYYMHLYYKFKMESACKADDIINVKIYADKIKESYSDLYNNDNMYVGSLHIACINCNIDIINLLITYFTPIYQYNGIISNMWKLYDMSVIKIILKIPTILLTYVIATLIDSNDIKNLTFMLNNTFVFMTTPEIIKYALDCACMRDNVDFIKILAPRIANKFKLTFAHHSVKVIKLLLTYPLYIPTYNTLQTVVRNGKLKLVKIILQYVNINIENIRDILIDAFNNDNKNIVLYLLRHETIKLHIKLHMSTLIYKIREGAHNLIDVIKTILTRDVILYKTNKLQLEQYAVIVHKKNNMEMFNVLINCQYLDNKRIYKNIIQILLTH